MRPSKSNRSEFVFPTYTESANISSFHNLQCEIGNRII